MTRRTALKVSPKRMATVASAIVAAVMLAGCGAGDDPVPPQESTAALTSGALLDDLVAECPLEDNPEASETRRIQDPTPTQHTSSPTPAMTCVSDVMGAAGFSLPEFPTTAQAESHQLPEGWTRTNTDPAGLVGEVTVQAADGPVVVKVVYAGGGTLELLAAGISVRIDQIG